MTSNNRYSPRYLRRSNLMHLYLIVLAAWMLTSSMTGIVLAWDNAVVHPGITSNAIVYINARGVGEVYEYGFLNSSIDPQCSRIDEGSVKEDMGDSPEWTGNPFNPNETSWNISRWGDKATDVECYSWKRHGFNPTTSAGWFNLSSWNAVDHGAIVWAAAVEEYRFIGKRNAYFKLGRCCHLLEDMSSPAHTQTDLHGLGDDAENWGKVNFSSGNYQPCAVRRPSTHGLQGMSSDTFGSFMSNVAWETYSATVYQGRLVTELGDVQPDSELKRMFPDIHYENDWISPDYWIIPEVGWFFNGVGNSEWWLSEGNNTDGSGYYYLENLNQEGGGVTYPNSGEWVVSAVRRNSFWDRIHVGDDLDAKLTANDTPLIELYAANLFPRATEWVAGLLQFFYEQTHPMPSIMSDASTLTMSPCTQSTITFTAGNSGGRTSTDMGYVSISVSSGLEIVGWASSNPDMNSCLTTAGNTGWHKDGNQIVLTHDLFDTWKTYDSEETNIVQITVQAKPSIGNDEWIKYRATFDRENTPSSGSETDQQGWSVYKIAVWTDDNPNLWVINDGDTTLLISNVTTWTSDGGSWLTVTGPTTPIGSGSSNGYRVVANNAGKTRGTYSGKVTVCSNDPDENLKEVPITMTVQNHAPVITDWVPADTTPSVNEGGSVAFSVTASDYDNDSLSYKWKVDGSTKSTSRNWTYSPEYSESGIRSVTARVSDGSLTASRSWSVIVNNVNRSPDISDLPDRSLLQNTSIYSAIDLWSYASDADTSSANLVLEITDNTNPNCGVSIADNRYIDINPTSGWLGTAMITVRVTDPEGASATDSFVVNVIDRSSYSGPPPLIDFRAEAGDSQIDLSWKEPQGSVLEGIRILRKHDTYPSSETDGTLVYDNLGRGMLDAHLRNNLTYYYSAYTYTNPTSFSLPSQASAIPLRGIGPAWWHSQSVIRDGETRNDHAAVNQGQLKWITLQSYNAMTGRYGEVSAEISNTVNGLRNTDNFTGVNLGQLKATAEAFYDYLSQSYPWTGTNSINYSVANIGQVKNAFSFNLPYPSQSLTSDPDVIAMWHFDEGVGNTLCDSSQYTNNGTISGASWTTGIFGTALNLDGVDNHVTVPYSTSLDISGTGLTFEVWIKPNEITRGSIYDLQHSGGCQVELTTNGQISIFFEFYDPNYRGACFETINAELQVGVWQHIAFTYDGSKVRFYKNGAELASWEENAPITQLGTKQALGIGYDVWDTLPGRHFNGMIDELRVTKRARTDFLLLSP